MPTVSQFAVMPYDPAETEWRDRIGWRIPIDDGHYSDILVTQIHLSGDAARQYNERRRQGAWERTTTIGAQGEDVLAGKLRAQDLVEGPMGTEIEDYVTLVGQGVIADRANDHLGRSDIGI